MPYEIEISLAGTENRALRLPASTTPIKEAEKTELYDNKPYEIKLFEDGKVVDGATFFIGQEKIDSDRLNTFEGYYGWIIISAEVSNTPTISTGHIRVMIGDKKAREQIPKMIEYIANRSKDINFPENVNDLFGISTDGANRNFKTADLLNHIYEEYERNFRHFYNNSRARLSEAKTVDNVEKLKGFSSDTFRFILTHPQYLTESKSGIRMGDKFFTPFKTLVSSNKKGLNIYENQVILGFLKYVIEWMNATGDIRSLKDFYLDTSSGNEIKFVDKDSLLEKLRISYKKYKSIFGDVDDVRVSTLPSMTHIFKNVCHYQNIYEYMQMFFIGGIISPSDENKVRWYLDTSSRIYEYYVFLKLDEKIVNEGFKRVLIKQTDNDILPQYFSYDNETRGEKKYLYYQPKIPHIDNPSSEGINLKRFTSVSFSDRKSTKEYTPDYIIKTVDKTGAETYEIADAKFSDFNTVRNYYIPPSIFKYLASVEALNDAKISGLTLYYCKGDKKGQFEHPTIKDPYVKIVPLSE